MLMMPEATGGKERYNMFDTVKNRKKRIAELRKKRDMTQFEIADRLGISYQAVSNWERGNSMPDIAKLPELAEIFGVTVDEILGSGNPVVEKVTAGEPVQPADYTREELKEAAEVLRPSQVEKLAGEVRGRQREPADTGAIPGRGNRGRAGHTAGAGGVAMLQAWSPLWQKKRWMNWRCCWSRMVRIPWHLPLS